MEQKKNKVSKKQIEEAIKQRALVLKRKIELYNEAKKINDELKQLNEVNTIGRGFMAGPGFKNRVDAQGNQRDSHEHIVGGKGAVTGRSATASDVEFGQASREAIKETEGEEGAQIGSNDGQGGRIYKFEELYGLEEEMTNLGIDTASEGEGVNTLDEMQAENDMLKEKIAKFEEAYTAISESFSKTASSDAKKK